MDIFKKDIFIRLFPLDYLKIRQLSEEDKSELIYIFSIVAMELKSRGIALMKRGFWFEDPEHVFFSPMPYIEIIKNCGMYKVEKSDINMMNMMLYMKQYKAPIGWILSPLIPEKYYV